MVELEKEACWPWDILRKHVVFIITTVNFFNMAKHVLYGIKHVGKTQWKIFETFKASHSLISNINECTKFEDNW